MIEDFLEQGQGSKCSTAPAANLTFTSDRLLVKKMTMICSLRYFFNLAKVWQPNLIPYLR